MDSQAEQKSGSKIVDAARNVASKKAIGPLRKPMAFESFPLFQATLWSAANHATDPCSSNSRLKEARE